MNKMMNNVFKGLCIIGLSVFVFASIAFAGAASFAAGAAQGQAQQGEPKAQTPAVDDSWLSNGQALGPWWKKNPHKIIPTPDPILYHLEGNLAYTKMSGNVDSNVQKYDAALFLRKNFFTSMTVWGSTTNDSSINMQNKNLDIQKYDFNQMLGYDLSEKLSVGGGFMWKQDNSVYLDARNTFYIGSTYAFFNQPSFIFKLGAYYGYEDNSYMADDIQKDSGGAFAEPNVKGGLPDGYDSDGIRMIENITYMLNEKVTLLQGFDYMAYFKDSDYYHWNGNITMKVGITKTISFFTRYEINYDKNLLGVQYEKFFNFLKTIPKDKNDPSKGTKGDGYDVVWKDTAILAGLQFSL